jgi:hypothetical protein
VAVQHVGQDGDDLHGLLVAQQNAGPRAWLPIGAVQIASFRCPPSPSWPGELRGSALRLATVQTVSNRVAVPSPTLRWTLTVIPLEYDDIE